MRKNSVLIRISALSLILMFIFTLKYENGYAQSLNDCYEIDHEYIDAGPYQNCLHTGEECLVIYPCE